MLMHRTSTFFHYMANVSFDDFKSQMKKIFDHNNGKTKKTPIRIFIFALEIDNVEKSGGSAATTSMSGIGALREMFVGLGNGF